MESPAGKRPKWPWITLLALQFVQLLSLVPWVFMAGMSFMAFDAPGSTENPEAWRFVKIIWSYPLWLLAAGVTSWVLVFFRWSRTAVILGSLATIPMPAFWIVIILANTFRF